MSKNPNIRWLPVSQMFRFCCFYCFSFLVYQNEQFRYIYIFQHGLISLLFLFYFIIN